MFDVVYLLPLIVVKLREGFNRGLFQISKVKAIKSRSCRNSSSF